MSNKKHTMKNGKAVEVSEEIYKYLVKSDRRIRYIVMLYNKTWHQILKEV